MPNKIVEGLLVAVAKLQTEVQWIKRYLLGTLAVGGVVLLEVTRLLLK